MGYFPGAYLLWTLRLSSLCGLPDGQVADRASRLLQESDLPAEGALALGLTVLLAALSYRFFETPFLKMKKRHSVIESQPV